MVKMTIKERMFSKSSKLVDLVLDAIPKEGGEKSISTEFYDYRDGFKYELSISVKKELLQDEDEEVNIEDATIVYDDDGSTHIYDENGDEIFL